MIPTWAAQNGLRAGLPLANLAAAFDASLGVTAAAVAFVQTLPLSPEWQASLTAALALGYVVAQAYVDAQEGAS